MRTRGLTLIELLVVIAIAAVLMSLAAPSFKRQLQNARISSAVDSFASDLRFARGEAIRRSAPVIVCRSTAPEASPPACASGPQGKGWTSGWIVYHTGDGDSVIDADEVLRVQGRVDSVDEIVEDLNSSTTAIRFTATGRLQNLNSATSLQFGGPAFDPAVRRRLCIGLGGRARITTAPNCS